MKIVGRLVTNNSTLGRLTYQLHLEEFAELDDSEAQKVADWNTQAPWPPPKVLADLFEAHIGAVYEEYGWDFTKDWLSTLLRPLIEKANEDYLKNALAPPRYPYQWTYVTHERLTSPTIEVRFYDFLESRATSLASTAEPTLLLLPKDTKFIFGVYGDILIDSGTVEIAAHLVKFWVCEICMTLYPHNRDALYRAPHLISSITLLVTNAWTFGYLGSILKLASHFDPKDPDFSIHGNLLKSSSTRNFDNDNRNGTLRGKLAQALYAIIGWFYLQDNKLAEQWGIRWLIPLVVRAYDLIAQKPGFKPTFPYGVDETNPYIRVLVEMGRGPEVPLVTTQDELEEYLTAIVLGGKETRGRVFLTREDAKRIFNRRQSL